LPKGIQRRMSDAIETMGDAPTRPRPGVDIRRLRGLAPAWRLRVGDYRAIFAVEDDVIVFTRFGHRSNVYDI